MQLDGERSGAKKVGWFFGPVNLCYHYPGPGTQDCSDIELKLQQQIPAKIGSKFNYKLR